MITSEFVPVRHCRAIVARFTEELQEVLGAVCGNAATLKHQDCGCVLLHEQQGVACRPGEFRRPVPSLDLRFGLPWLSLYRHRFARPPWEFRRPVPCPDLRFGLPRGPSHTTRFLTYPIAAQLPHFSQFTPFTHSTMKRHDTKHLGRWVSSQLKVLFRMLPRRANSCGGTSHSDPITTTTQVLRPSTLPRSPIASRSTAT